MEEDALEMGMFDNLELNYDFNIPEEFENENTEDSADEIEIADPQPESTIEDESSEEVDSTADVEDEGDGNEDVASSSSNMFSSLANVLYEQGLLPSLDIENAEIKSIEDFTLAVQKEIQIQADARLQNYIDNIDTSTIASSKKEIDNLNQINEDYLRDNINVAKQLLYQDYINQGLTEVKANRLINRLVDLGEDALIEDSLDSLTSLKEFETKRIESQKLQYEKEVEEQRKQQAEVDATLKSLIFEKNDLIKGFKPTKSLQDKVYKTINEVVGKSPDGVFENKFMRDRRSNPLEFETRMYYFYELTNGFQDYSKLSTTAKSRAVKDLEKAFKAQPPINTGGTPSFFKTNDSGWDYGTELNL